MKRRGFVKRGCVPTLYRAEYPHIARILASEGFNDAMLAKVFAVKPPTLAHWKATRPAFADAIKVGRQPVTQGSCALADAVRAGRQRVAQGGCA